MEKNVMKFSISPTTQKSSFTRHLTSWVAILTMFVGTIFMNLETAHAGLVSYMVSFLGGEQASAKISQNYSQGNSQTIALLQAAANRDPNPEKSSGASPIVDDTLIADIALSETATTESVNTQISSYIVRDGDTLSGIAKMFGVSANTIMWANNISRASALRTGQTIIILPVTGINYTIAKGDTIKGIALRYKADIDEILRYNDLTLDTTLVVGRTIIIPDAEIRVSVPTRSIAVGSNPAHDTNGPDYAGYYTRPVVGGVRTQGLHGYNGIDIGAPVGTPIYASAAGTVIVSAVGGWNGGYGNLVIISHANGTQTVYAHNSKNLVTVGQLVDQGQKIALMGATGKATGSHVHFEIRGAKNPF
jgi:LysM repeat protein